ncbi:MAG: acyl-CoA dehydrogenase family protein [Proteobacteria bacterium]|nr:acyl-CoA dehydrogenase family protein [Pseudomonadota bacterium]
MSAPFADDPASRALALTPLVRECADEAERERRLPERLAVAMADAGLYRIAAPASVGGGECDPRTQIETIEVVSHADGAAGWNLMIGIENVGFLGAALTREAAEKIFADPRLVVAGALNPVGRATPVEGGYRVTGQWPFASGCHNAQYFWGQCIVYDGDAPVPGPSGGLTLREAVVPAADFEIVDTWHVSGMRGSGSHDVAVRDVFVPHEHITAALSTPPRESGPLFRFPPFCRLAYNKVGVSTGIARAALDHFAELAAETKRRGSARALRDKPAVQLAVAEAETLLRSARAFVFDAVGDVWDTAQAGDEVDRRQRAAVHLACSNAAGASVRAVELVHAAAGSAANFTAHPLDRCLRNVRVVPQHIMVSAQWMQSAAGVLLGLDSELPFF